jgi:hypothetical protein
MGTARREKLQIILHSGFNASDFAKLWSTLINDSYNCSTYEYFLGDDELDINYCITYFSFLLDLS